MSVHKLTAGDGYTYLTRQVAVHDATDRGHSGLADYYAEKGESPGRWFGAGVEAVGLGVGAEVTEQQMKNLFGEGRHPDAQRLEEAALASGATVAEADRASKLGRLFQVSRGSQPEFLQETARRYVDYNLDRGLHWKTPVPADVRAGIRTALANELFARVHGRSPIDDRERGSFMATATRQNTTAVAGYDLTFTPVKSVSTLWALADRNVAQQVEDAHHAAVESTLQWLEHEVLFTRRGRGGIQQIKARGLLAALFTHRDARSSDPHLHTHVAISNKVQDRHGNWLAVDGRVLFKANVTLSERYNSLLEGELVARLGVEFAERADTVARADAKRSVREIVGVDRGLAKAWSKRNADIEARRRELTAAFQRDHRRPPTSGEAATLAEQAWSQTRQAKHAPRSESEQREVWRREAASVLGSEDAIATMVDGCLGRGAAPTPVTQQWIDETAQAVVARVARDRSTWQVWHLRAEAFRLARGRGLSKENLDEAIDQIVDTAIASHCIAFDDVDPLLRASTSPVTIPAPLTRVDADETVSVYSLAGTRQYTSEGVLDAERRVLAAASRIGGRAVADVRVGIAVAEAAANGIELNTAQQEMVREMATSGRAVQLTLAPAGTGKTTAMQVLTRAWQQASGTVIGLAPSAVAAQELGGSINTDHEHRVVTDTLAKMVWHIHNGDAPAWMAAIDHRTLVLVDEAGMAATADLADVIDYVTGRGGQVRLIGDDKQLASVAAGGVLRDIHHQMGAVTLSEVHRFRNPDGSSNHAEAAATLALREGDPSALAYYADRGRIHVGDLGTCAAQAYAAWAQERSEGIDSILIAPTRELVAELNTRARNDRLASMYDMSYGDAVALADGTHASAGDLVVTRRNDRFLAVSSTDWVKNGDRWSIGAVHADGALTVRHADHGKTVTLPAAYVAASVQLGYATTVHGAQGMTTGTSHVVLAGAEDRNLLYVALSRGRRANHLYLNVASDGDPHDVIRPEALIPPTVLDTLTEILRRDGSPTSATTAQRLDRSPATLLRDAATRYEDAVCAAAESLVGDLTVAAIDEHAETLHAGLTEAPAWNTLRLRLVFRALEGENPLHLLTAAHAMSGLGDARDPAAVLEARLTCLADGRDEQSDPADKLVQVLPWLPPIPAAVHDDVDWGHFVDAYRTRTLDLIEPVRADATAWTTETAPVWAQPFLQTHDSTLLADLAVWRAAHAVPDADHRPTGARMIGAPGEAQRSLNRRGRDASPQIDVEQRDWFIALPRTVLNDPWSSQLLQRLTRLDGAGVPLDDYVRAALTEDAGEDAWRPLPVENPAAALWWRLVPYLGPAALTADAHTVDQPQTADLEEVPDHEAPASEDALPHDADDYFAEFDAPPLLFDEHPTLGRNDPYGMPLPWEIEVTAEDAFLAPGELPAERIHELNAWAADFYTAQAHRSWVPDYLLERIHTDLADHDTFTAGYAPVGPRALMNHLQMLGASVDELEKSGLIRLRERRDGTTDHVDCFRDRLVLPIRDPRTGAINGFVGRRNPSKSDDDYAGPKYLNTKTTTAFAKREALFGYAEGRALLDAGALPVLVEGPMDALAITLGSEGRAVGLAPMGTALTVEQIKLIRSKMNLTTGRDRIVVATDHDAAGWKAGQIAYWHLTAADLDPVHLALSDGEDPASLFQNSGAPAITALLDGRRPLANAMLDDLLRTSGSWSDADVRAQIVDAAARIIAARGTDVWADSIGRVGHRLHLPDGLLLRSTLNASIDRDGNALSWSVAQVHHVRDSATSSSPSGRMAGPQREMLIAPRGQRRDQRRVWKAPVER